MSRPSERPRPAFRLGLVRSSLLGAVALLLVCHPPATAQLDQGGVYAIQGARLVTVSGAVIEQGTIVVRDGLIEALGRNVTPPADAVVIDGQGLTVYPGFIDGFSQTGIELPPARERSPAPNIAHHLATEWFDPSSTGIDNWRQQGFTTALVARNDGLFSGQAVLVNLMGSDTPSMTVKAPVVQVLTYSGQRGYPSTLMAVVAYQRQTLIDAAYHAMLLARYSRQPRGMVRPPHEPALEALIPAAGGQAPLLVEVNSENDFKRLRDLTAEFGIKVWITGAHEAYRVPDLVRQFGAPVIVSLNFPTPQRVTGYWYERAYRNLDAEENRALDERDRKAIRGNPAAVHRLGVPLMFSTSGLNPGQFWSNLRTAIQEGLPAAEALKGLTIIPARQFGVEQIMGTLEAGKIANLTVTRGDPFTEDSARITHLLVDGRLQVLAAASAAPAAAQPPRAAAADLTGEWALTVEVPQSNEPVLLQIAQEQERVTGTISTPMGAVALSGTFQEGRLQLSGEIPELGTMSLTGTVRGADMTGSLRFGPMGEIAFSGSKRPSTPTPGEGGNPS